jgi:hypothetical protein
MCEERRVANTQMRRLQVSLKLLVCEALRFSIKALYCARSAVVNTQMRRLQVSLKLPVSGALSY